MRPPTCADSASRDIIPAVNAYLGEVANTAAAKLSVLHDVNCVVEKEILTKLSNLNAKAYTDLEVLKRCETKAASVKETVARAEAYRDLVVPAMNALRSDVDEMETMTASEYWPLPTYGDMMFKI